MGKIVKKSVDKIVLNKKKFSLGMKGEFKIEFASDSFGPYKYKFQREDCYFNDGLEDRGTKIFPMKNKTFDNTEIFLETDDIVIATGERGSLSGSKKEFIDIINIKTEKKYRFFTDEINLIYNTKDSIVINAKSEGRFKTKVLDINSMKKIEERDEELNAFFKCVYNTTDKKWYVLDFTSLNATEKDEDKKYQSGYFGLDHLEGFDGDKPLNFDRTTFLVITKGSSIDLWDKSFKG